MFNNNIKKFHNTFNFFFVLKEIKSLTMQRGKAFPKLSRGKALFRK
jgi:hypothetical protein